MIQGPAEAEAALWAAVARIATRFHPDKIILFGAWAGGGGDIIPVFHCSNIPSFQYSIAASRRRAGPGVRAIKGFSFASVGVRMGGRAYGVPAGGWAALESARRE